jgi:hypothetical protein
MNVNKEQGMKKYIRERNEMKRGTEKAKEARSRNFKQPDIII